MAVLVSKATCEIPPKFAGWAPVNPAADPHVAWRGARGLAEDIRYYGRWMRDRAWQRIGHLYPKAAVTAEMAATRPDLAPYAGKDLTVIAWLWTRTVASPDPMLQGAHVPLVRSFVLSSKPGSKAWIEPVIEPSGCGWRFRVRTGSGVPPDGTVGRRGGICLLSGTPMPFAHIRSEGKAGRMGARLMAIVAKGNRRRVYLNPTEEMEEAARSAMPEWRPDSQLPHNPRDFKTPNYGMVTFADLFTPRQLTALTTFSGLVSEARDQVKHDALTYPPPPRRPDIPLAEGGTGAQAYADAVATYLGLCVSRQANRCSNLSFWNTQGEKIEQVFARQALPMVWDFCEANPFSDSSGNFVGQTGYLANVVAATPTAAAQAAVIQQDAAGETSLADNAVVATDPPYYDNIGYADLSDFFYVWQRRALRQVWPDLFRRILTPKNEELVATPYRHDNREAAERFFMEGIGRALRNLHRAGAGDVPITLYYAFKQSEVTQEGLTSPGWATFLQGVFRRRLCHRRHMAGADRACRCFEEKGQRPSPRPSSWSAANARRTLAPSPGATSWRGCAPRLPTALRHIRAGGVGPVDMAQAALGPGMGIFTAFSRVLEPDDAAMSVRAAIALINQVRDEISGEEATGYDAATRFCIDWFEAFGMAEGKAGDAITMSRAYDIGIADLEATGAFVASGGTARLLRRDELPADWQPGPNPTHWQCAWHLARSLEAPDGGVEAAAQLLTAMGPENGEAARLLAYRLYDICERASRAAEAQAWNMLAQEWPALETATERTEAGLREEGLPFVVPPA